MLEPGDSCELVIVRITTADLTLEPSSVTVRGGAAELEIDILADLDCPPPPMSC